jgi:hypothetical protein
MKAGPAVGENDSLFRLDLAEKDPSIRPKLNQRMNGIFSAPCSAWPMRSHVKQLSVSAVARW